MQADHHYNKPCSQQQQEAQQDAGIDNVDSSSPQQAHHRASQQIAENPSLEE
jgi:hypothetical protein